MNLAATLLADAGADPGRLVSVGDSGPVGLRDLGDRSRIVSAVLAAHGVRAGDVVALALPDRPAPRKKYEALDIRGVMPGELASLALNEPTQAALLAARQRGWIART